MKKIIFYIAALSLMAVACNKAELNPVEGGEEKAPAANMIIETISGTSEMSTKVTIGNANNSFAWTDGDKIAVHVSKGDSHKYVVTAGATVDPSDATRASFTVTYEEGYARDAFAVYPGTIVTASAANYGQSGASLDVTLPNSYTLEQVSGETTPCPMIATNTPDSDWEFKQLCGLLRLTVNSIPANAKRLEIDFNGKKVCGSFSVSADVTPGNSVINTADDTDNDCITITKDGTSDEPLFSGWGDGKVFNIPLPVGTYSNITVTAYDALTDGDAILTMTRTLKNGAATYTASRKGGIKRTISFLVFSVSATKRVIFAPGNLQATYDATGQTWSWGFAAHQYDRIGGNGGNKLITTTTIESSEPYARLSADGTVDLFGRSTDKTYYGIATSTNVSDYNGTFVDWGGLDIRKNTTPPYTYYPTNYWHTLSEAEWQYLIGEETYRHTGGTIQWAEGSTTHVILNALCTKATVNGIHGLIIFPDYYSGNMPLGVAWDENSISPGSMVHSGTTGWASTATSAGWATLEAEGCVFLPIEGFRIGSYEVQGQVYYNVLANTSSGYYMSSNSVTNVLRFSNEGFDPNQGLGSYSYAGRSVRLAHEVK